MSDDGISRTPLTSCPVCGKPIDGAMMHDLSDSVPSEGDISICLGCLAVNIYRADQTIRAMTDHEWLDISLEHRTEIQHAQDRILQIKERSKHPRS